MPPLPSAHRDRHVVGYSSLAVAAIATFFAFLTASGVFDETSCLRAGGIFDDATGGCHVSDGASHLAPSEQPAMYAIWILTVVLCSVVAWLMLRHRSRRHRGRRQRSSRQPRGLSPAAVARGSREEHASRLDDDRVTDDDKED